MVASRSRVLSAGLSARFWFSACAIALMPTSVGYQDLAALLARERGAAASWHLIASPLGTVETAAFHYTRPVGSAIPEPLALFQRVDFEPGALDAYAWKIDEPLTIRPQHQVDYPTVNRAKKGDRLPLAQPAQQPASAGVAPLQPVNAPAASAPVQAAPAAPAVAPAGKIEHAAIPAAAQPPAPAAAASVATMEVHADAAPAAALPQAAPDGSAKSHAAAADDDPTLADKPPELPGPGDSAAYSTFDETSFLDENATDHTAQIYFGSSVMGLPSGLQNWAPGAEPILAAPSGAPGAKLAALEDTDEGEADRPVAGKDNSRVLSPAQALNLTGKARARAEKCLADAVYFEARGEVLKGQEAVAQVVMNRVFSGVYPHDVCGVVYQNADRHLACQFTFACEGKNLNKIDEPDMWEQAKRIAKDELDGKIWLSEVGHATHYHAYWVHPSWVHEMARLYHLGVHTFYRPRNWGNGDDEPVWGQGPAMVGVRLDPEVLNENPEPAPRPAPETPSTAAATRPDTRAAAAKGPQASAAPATEKSDATAKL